MNAVLSAWAWAQMAVIAAGGFVIHGLLFLVTRPFDPNRLVSGRFFRLLGVAVTRVSPFWDFSIHGTFQRPAPGTVVISNHESNADAFLIALYPWEMKWLAKESMLNVPFIGWSMRLAGDITVKRGSSSSGREALEECARWIDRGVPVMIFPEGTRSRTAGLLPFKDGAFRLAIEKQVELLPLAVSGTRKSLPSKSWKFAPARGLVKMGTPISTKGMTLADLRRLKELARAQIEQMRKELEPLTTT